jgi:hypothetical protein
MEIIYNGPNARHTQRTKGKETFLSWRTQYQAGGKLDLESRTYRKDGIHTPGCHGDELRGNDNRRSKRNFSKSSPEDERISPNPRGGTINYQKPHTARATPQTMNTPFMQSTSEGLVLFYEQQR